jgi:flavorubredoxin
MTTVAEIADGIYRIHTPVAEKDIGIPGGFSFNQYLVVDDEPLLFHTGLRRIFPQVRDAVATVLPPERLRWIAFSHFEADECGALNDWLAVAPNAAPLCSSIGAVVSVGDFADRPPRGLADGEEVSLGRHCVRWLSAPHLPHGWDCGYMFETVTKTLFCGDLFTQPGLGETAIGEEDVLGPSVAMMRGMDYFAHAPDSGALLEKLAATGPRVLAVMHGTCYRGDGASLLKRLGESLGMAVGA